MSHPALVAQAILNDIELLLHVAERPEVGFAPDRFARTRRWLHEQRVRHQLAQVPPGWSPRTWPDRAEFAALQADGRECFFALVPTIGPAGWVAEEGESWTGIRRPAVLRRMAWGNTLITRPAWDPPAATRKPRRTQKKIRMKSE